MTDYIDVSELAGDQVSEEQVERLCHRYYWAGSYCAGKDVVEAACGSGAGISFIAGIARTLCAGDYSGPILDRVRRHYGERVVLRRFDAQDMPFADASLDIVILFEALYFIPSPEKFATECRRVLRPGGVVLIATANPDLYDFNPCPHSRRYFGVTGLRDLLVPLGFDVRCFGYLRTDRVSLRQRILRPVKKIAVSLDLIPKTMASKALLKRIVFGRLLAMPAEITPGLVAYTPPAPIPADLPDRAHKVIYCAATFS
jgi:SAM-dependent methyltransferase